jgi:hypothetical protein
VDKSKGISESRRSEVEVTTMLEYLLRTFGMRIENARASKRIKSIRHPDLATLFDSEIEKISEAQHRVIIANNNRELQK